MARGIFLKFVTPIDFYSSNSKIALSGLNSLKKCFLYTIIIKNIYLKIIDFWSFNRGCHPKSTGTSLTVYHYFILVLLKKTRFMLCSIDHLINFTNTLKMNMFLA